MNRCFWNQLRKLIDIGNKTIAIISENVNECKVFYLNKIPSELILDNCGYDNDYILLKNNTTLVFIDFKCINMCINNKFDKFDYILFDKINKSNNEISSYVKMIKKHIFYPHKHIYYTERFKKEYGYHKIQITKGTFGEFSKIEEEIQELFDSHKQENKILELVELSDLIGAIEGYVEKKYNISLDDVIKMKESTKNAFLCGKR